MMTSKPLRILLAGLPGAGKTRLSVTAPNPIVADCAGGSLTIPSSIVSKIGSSDDLLALKDDLDGFDTLVLDTVDEFQRILLAERLVSERRSETNASDYGWIGQRLHTVFEALCGLPQHVVVTTNLKEVQDGESGAVWFKPGLAGGFTDQICQYMDYRFLVRTVGSVNSDGSNYSSVSYFVTRPVEGVGWLKDSSGLLEPVVDVGFVDDLSGVVRCVGGSVGDGSSVKEVADVVIAETGDALSEQSLEPKEPEPAVRKVTPNSGIDCSECGNEIDTKDRYDLSMLKFQVPLCVSCFNLRRKQEK